MVFLGVVLLLSFIGWVMVLVAAFRSSVWWGLGILIGPFAIYAIFRNNLWANVIVGLALISAFAFQHWDTARTGFIIYVVGYALSIPGQLQLMKKVEGLQAEQQASVAKESQPEVRAPRPYTAASVAVLTPEPAAVVPPPQKVNRTPRAPSNERPDVYMATTVTRVYVNNVTKKYYPLDCKARPEGAYPMVKSLATREGFKLAEECATKN